MNLRVLHAVRVSFVRQFDCGFIDIVVLRALLRILDEALDSKDHTMKFEPVLAQLQEKHHNVKHNASLILILELFILFIL